MPTYQPMDHTILLLRWRRTTQAVDALEAADLDEDPWIFDRRVRNVEIHAARLAEALAELLERGGAAQCSTAVV